MDTAKASQGDSLVVRWLRTPRVKDSLNAFNELSVVSFKYGKYASPSKSSVWGAQGTAKNQRVPALQGLGAAHLESVEGGQWESRCASPPTCSVAWTEASGPSLCVTWCSRSLRLPPFQNYCC